MFIGEVKWKARPMNYEDLEKFLMKLQKINSKKALLILVSRSGFSRSVKNYIEDKGGILLDLNQLCNIWNELK